jgi:hypothetical protein
MLNLVNARALPQNGPDAVKIGKPDATKSDDDYVNFFVT